MYIYSETVFLVRKQKLINSKKPVNVLAETYALIIQCLRGLKGLSEEESRVFIAINNRKFVTVKEVMQIFSDVGSPVSRTNAYAIVEKFVHAELLLEDHTSKTKSYRAVHPRTLSVTLDDALKKIKKEISQLEQSYETSDFEEEDPRKISKTLHSESEIMTECNILNKNCNLTLISDGDLQVKEFFNNLSDDKTIIKGKINTILFKNSKNDKNGVIQISKRRDKEGNSRLFGQILFDSDKYNYFLKQEAKKNG